MWCVHCRQDVPAIASHDGILACPRCGKAVVLDGPQPPDTYSTSGSDVFFSPAPSSIESETLSDPMMQWDDWEMDEELRRIFRVLQAENELTARKETESRPAIVRFDSPCAKASARHRPAVNHSKPIRNTNLGALHAISDSLGWLALLFGSACLACGGLLGLWSLAAHRPDLWMAGLLAVIAGQIVLLLWTVKQCDRLGRDQRETAEILDAADRIFHQKSGRHRGAPTALGSAFR